MDQAKGAAAAAEAAAQKNKRIRPQKTLPTERITFPRQLELLRGYAAASGTTGKAVSNKDVAGLVDMTDTTTSIANAFFLDVGFLTKTQDGFLPSPEVVSFLRAYEWNKETASHKLAPILSATWFADTLMPKLSMRPLEESEAIAALAEAATASPEYKGQLKVLIDYLEGSGLVQRDGGLIKKVAALPPNTRRPGSDLSEKPAQPNKSAAEPTFPLQPMEGVVQFNVSVKVDMSEFKDWPQEKIASFFGGIAQVLAAKGTIEKTQN